MLFINESLVANEGTIWQATLLNKDFDWTHLFIVRDKWKIIGFAIIRYSNYDQHMTGFNEYYYISDIVVARNYQNKGIGTMLLNFILDSIIDLPIVSSVKDNNNHSLKLFKKHMKVYDKTNGGYYRYLDNKSYDLRAGYISNEHKF